MTLGRQSELAAAIRKDPDLFGSVALFFYWCRRLVFYCCSIVSAYVRASRRLGNGVHWRAHIPYLITSLYKKNSAAYAHRRNVKRRTRDIRSVVQRSIEIRSLRANTNLPNEAWLRRRIERTSSPCRLSEAIKTDKTCIGVGR